MKNLLLIFIIVVCSWADEFHFKTSDTMRVVSIDLVDNGSHVIVIYQQIKKRFIFKDTVYVKEDYVREPDIAQDYGVKNWIDYTWALSRTIGYMVSDTIEKHIKWR